MFSALTAYYKFILYYHGILAVAMDLSPLYYNLEADFINLVFYCYKKETYYEDTDLRNTGG